MQMGMLFIVVVVELNMNCYEWNSENCMCFFSMVLFIINTSLIYHLVCIAFTWYANCVVLET
jgi:hypothetical protein